MIHPRHKDSRTIYHAEQSEQTTNEVRQQEMWKPQVPQLLRGFHHGHELAGVIPNKLVEKIQGNDRGVIKPLGKSTKVKIVISMEIQVNQIGERYCEREK